MAVTYTWAVRSLRKRSTPGFPDAVFDVHWTYTGTDGNGLTYETLGATGLPEASADGFIPFAELTESTVIGWLESQVNMARLRAQVDTQLALLANPPEEVSIDRLPWVAQN